jgi:hypothetical protein
MEIIGFVATIGTLLTDLLQEERWFTGWQRPRHVESLYLPESVQKIQKAMTVPIGDAIISTVDSTFAAESCEVCRMGCSVIVFDETGALHTIESSYRSELERRRNISNSSSSHHELRKLGQRISLIVMPPRGEEVRACREVCGLRNLSSDKSRGPIGLHGSDLNRCLHLRQPTRL